MTPGNEIALESESFKSMVLRHHAALSERFNLLFRLLATGDMKDHIYQRRIERLERDVFELKLEILSRKNELK